MGQGGQRSSSKGKRMKKFQQIREAANAAQQAAIAIAKKEKGEKPKNEQKVECPECEGEGCDHCDGKGYHMKEGKKMDPAAMAKAMAAFKKKGGKIKKVAPGKAAGYHGKDDPGDNVHGMMDRGDTKGMPRKKKIGSMK